ncbi:MAG: undecaprenyldiphospho-muramoylpentapeptide beta-N-acetylglucosaminyltransferase [Candidatus Cryptobacteroides sp.]
MKNRLRVLISGGGTGGHIFPALSIADALKRENPETEILFVGAEGRMEMEKVPAAGYRIQALPIAGLKRSLSADNLALPFKVLKSIGMAKKIIREFKPDIAVGVGGYASAPLLWAAQRCGVPTLIQEQNGFAGLTNRILGRRAKKICVAYGGMERFFPADRIVMTGNPIRESMKPATAGQKAEGVGFYGLAPERKHLLIIGGSLGSGTLNKSVMKWVSDGCPGGGDFDVLWQCGRYYEKEVDGFMAGRKEAAFIHHTAFIGRMDLAYAAADLLVSRSGASSVSEICACGKAAIFVPSPNVTEDHQTHNAMALVNRGAGKIVKDADAPQQLMALAAALLSDEATIREMERNSLALALPGAAEAIVGEIYSVTGK